MTEDIYQSEMYKALCLSMHVAIAAMSGDHNLKTRAMKSKIVELADLAKTADLDRIGLSAILALAGGLAARISRAYPLKTPHDIMMDFGIADTAAEHFVTIHQTAVRQAKEERDE